MKVPFSSVHSVEWLDDVQQRVACRPRTTATGSTVLVYFQISKEEGTLSALFCRLANDRNDATGICDVISCYLILLNYSVNVLSEYYGLCAQPSFVYCICASNLLNSSRRTRERKTGKIEESDNLIIMIRRGVSLLDSRSTLCRKRISVLTTVVVRPYSPIPLHSRLSDYPSLRSFLISHSMRQLLTKTDISHYDR